MLCSAPLNHCAVAGCLPFRLHQGTSMLHWGHRGSGMFPSSKMTTASRTCQFIKCTCIVVLFSTRPGHPSTWQIHRRPLVGKDVRYVHGSSPMSDVFQIHISSPAFPWCVILFLTNDPSTISSPYSLHCTRPLWRYC